MRWVRAIRQSRRNTLPYLRQFLLFTLICAPLGLWWQVKNAVLYGVPLTYVPRIGNDDWAYLGQYSLGQRLIGFSFTSLKRVFVLYDPSLFCEYSIPLALLKSSLFDEHQLFSTGSAGFALCRGLLAVNTVLIVASLAAMSAFAICKRRFADRPVTAALYVHWGATLLQYLKFCLDYPHTCSMTFRYIPSTLLIGCLFLGYAVSTLDENGRWCKIIAWALRGLCGLFCVLSCGMFLLLGLA